MKENIRKNYKPNGKNLRLGLQKGERQGKTIDLGRNHEPRRPDQFM
jgi:hypothetical protein